MSLSRKQLRAFSSPFSRTKKVTSQFDFTQSSKEGIALHLLLLHLVCIEDTQSVGHSGCGVRDLELQLRVVEGRIIGVESRESGAIFGSDHHLAHSERRKETEKEMRKRQGIRNGEEEQL